MVQIAEVASRNARRKHEILHAASELFRQRGFHATGMRDVAAALGMHAGNLYYYFENKHELLAFCQEETLNRLLAAADEIRAADVSADRQLLALIAAHVRCLNEDTPGSLAHLEVEALSGAWRTRIQAQRDRYEARIRKLVRQGIAEGVFRPADPKLVTLAILGAVNWTVKWYRPRGAKSVRTVGREFAAHLVRGLLAPGRELPEEAVPE